MSIEDQAFSRTPASAIGKMLDDLKTKVDPDTALQFQQIVREAGTDVAGALRDYVFSVVHGETFTDMVIREAEIKRDKMRSKGLNRGLNGAAKA